jgi:CxxC motif-containing protein
MNVKIEEVLTTGGSLRVFDAIIQLSPLSTDHLSKKLAKECCCDVHEAKLVAPGKNGDLLN